MLKKSLLGEGTLHLFQSAGLVEVLQLSSKVGQLSVSGAELQVDGAVLGRSSGVPAEHGLSGHEDGELEVAIDLERRTSVDAGGLELSDGVLEGPLAVSDGLGETKEHGGDLVHVVGVVVSNDRSIATSSVLRDAESDGTIELGLSGALNRSNGLLATSGTTSAAQHGLNAVPDDFSSLQASLDHEINLHTLVGRAVALHVDLILELHTGLQLLVLGQNGADVDDSQGAHGEGGHRDQKGLEVEDGHDGVARRDNQRLVLLGLLETANLVVLLQMASLEPAVVSVRSKREGQNRLATKMKSGQCLLQAYSEVPTSMWVSGKSVKPR